MKKIDTFSANSLKLLEKSQKEFIDRYIYNLDIFKKDPRSELGQKFHSLICAYIKGFEIEKATLELDEKEKEIWQKLKVEIDKIKKYFIKNEYSFLIKESHNGEYYYLTGRFDGIAKTNDEYIIYDWKTLNLPKDPENDLQTVVYLFCASKIFKSEKIKMRYLSIEKLNSVEICFKDEKTYKTRIERVLEKNLINSCENDVI